MSYHITFGDRGREGLSKNGYGIFVRLYDIRATLYGRFVEQRFSDEQYQSIIERELRGLERLLAPIRDSGGRDSLVELEGIKRNAVSHDAITAFSAAQQAVNAYIKFVESITPWSEVSRVLLTELSGTICGSAGSCKCICLNCVMDRAAGGHPGPIHCKSHRMDCHIGCFPSAG
jgi:hypothetical protein